MWSPQAHGSWFPDPFCGRPCHAKQMEWAWRSVGKGGSLQNNERTTGSFHENKGKEETQVNVSVLDIRVGQVIKVWKHPSADSWVYYCLFSKSGIYEGSTLCLKLKMFHLYNYEWQFICGGDWPWRRWSPSGCEWTCKIYEGGRYQCFLLARAQFQACRQQHPCDHNHFSLFPFPAECIFGMLLSFISTALGPCAYLNNIQSADPWDPLADPAFTSFTLRPFCASPNVHILQLHNMHSHLLLHSMHLPHSCLA